VSKRKLGLKAFVSAARYSAIYTAIATRGFAAVGAYTLAVIDGTMTPFAKRDLGFAFHTFPASILRIEDQN
jgi:hypothetical protein